LNKLAVNIFGFKKVNRQLFQREKVNRFNKVEVKLFDFNYTACFLNTTERPFLLEKL
jgi:hypothetical protein